MKHDRKQQCSIRKSALMLSVSLLLTSGFTILGTTSARAKAAPDTSAAEKASSDVIFSSLDKEMNRSLKDLRAEDHPPPYYISVSMLDLQEVDFESKFGGEISTDRYHRRFLTPVVKVGNYALDSTPVRGTPHMSPMNVTVDDNELALRRQLWHKIDTEYKNAIRDYQSKQSYLINNTTEAKSSDMNKEPAVVSVADKQDLSCDEKKWSKTTQDLSAVFLKYPQLQKAKITFQAKNYTRWFINSEGSKIRYSHPVYDVIITASGQAENGEEIADNDVVAVNSEAEMPTIEALTDRVEAMAKRLSAILKAPAGETYCGPVIFEGEAAAELVGQVLANNFGRAEDSLSAINAHPYRNAIGRRVITKGINVVDDPLAKAFKGQPLVGGNLYDDDGVPVQKVTLVENGVLKNFCQSRIPTKNSDKSNGHSIHGVGVYNTIFVSSDKTVSAEEVRAKAIEMAKDAGLDYLLVIKRISDGFHVEHPGTYTQSNNWTINPSYTKSPSEPLLVYKLNIASGKEELVRGLEFRNISLRAFRDIQAVGDDAQAYLIEPDDGITRDLITPTLLIGELELDALHESHATTPLLPSPLSLQQGSPSVAVNKDTPETTDTK